MTLPAARVTSMPACDMPFRSRLRAQVVPVPELEACVRRAMYALYERYYAQTDARAFNDDLDGKQQVLLMHDAGGQLRGFSSLCVLRLGGTGALRAIFSGDTVVDHRFWGQQALAFSWIRLAGRIAREEPAIPLYWFLIVKGYRTYRYLHAFTRRYYPHWRDPTPAAEQALLHRLAGARFGTHYDPATGVVRFPRSRGQLRRRWAAVEDAARGRPEVRHFLRCNPGYAAGDELVCLTRLEGANLRPLARRLFEQEP
jgi:hypothetical protein